MCLTRVVGTVVLLQCSSYLSVFSVVCPPCFSGLQFCQNGVGSRGLVIRFPGEFLELREPRAAATGARSVVTLVDVLVLVLHVPAEVTMTNGHNSAWNWCTDTPSSPLNAI